MENYIHCTVTGCPELDRLVTRQKKEIAFQEFLVPGSLSIETHENDILDYLVPVPVPDASCSEFNLFYRLDVVTFAMLLVMNKRGGRVNRYNR